MAPNPLVVGAPSYGVLPGRMRCGPYRGEGTNVEEVPARHAAAQRLTFSYNGKGTRTPQSAGARTLGAGQAIRMGLGVSADSFSQVEERRARSKGLLSRSQ